MRRHLTFANVTALMALVISMGGVGYAAVKLPANSVGAKQLQANSVTGAKVKDGSLTGKDLKASTLGTVPKATKAGTATTAGNALALGGVPASGYLKPASTVGGDLAGTASAPTIGVLPYGSMQGVLGQCGSQNGDTVEFDGSTNKEAVAGMTLAEDSECSDTDADTTIVVPRNGLYLITADLSWQHDTTGDRRVEIIATSSGQTCDDAVSSQSILATAEVPPTTANGAWTQVPISTEQPLATGEGICVAADAFESTNPVSLNLGGSNLTVAYMSTLPG